MTSNATHTIATDAQPQIPSGWKVQEHRGMGNLSLELREGLLFANGKEVALFLSDRQNSGSIRGHELRKDLASRPALNACVLDYLLEHQELIPESWKGKVVYFWGTIFRDSVGGLCVGCLYWGGDRWDWYCHWFDDRWLSVEPAAVLAA